MSFAILHYPSGEQIYTGTLGEFLVPSSTNCTDNYCIYERFHHPLHNIICQCSYAVYKRYVREKQEKEIKKYNLKKRIEEKKKIQSQNNEQRKVTRSLCDQFHYNLPKVTQRRSKFKSRINSKN